MDGVIQLRGQPGRRRGGAGHTHGSSTSQPPRLRPWTFWVAKSKATPRLVMGSLWFLARAGQRARGGTTGGGSRGEGERGAGGREDRDGAADEEHDGEGSVAGR